ncbi:TetR family transcriptional regulator [Streptomyces sp. NHF165]|uniref:TetR family transcriptional regulator n=1 Tax=Streptomyces sp. NHF165 TaxID=2175864 RepID=UPI00132F4CE1|nr:TetR family transcriptional regulator [Streptomyces sp. NHF165]QHF95330.1 TetR family transcriptional regulator [Streptomyces sp. NHF165]
MAYDAEDTRRRIFAAAAAEFAERGLAGARVDRIARSARANKQAIYLYFGDKERLFTAVVRAKLEEVGAALSIDPDDIAASVGQLFDWHREHPELIRLLLWEALESAGPTGPDSEHAGAAAGGRGDAPEPGPSPDSGLRDAFQEKAAHLARAGDQRASEDERLRVAQDLLFSVMSLISWNFAVPRTCRATLGEETEAAALDRRRTAVIEAARTLATAAADDRGGS